jgi:hypothetical protein
MINIRANPVLSVTLAFVVVAMMLGASGCGGSNGAGSGSGTLTSLAISPGNPSIDVGQSEQFTAEGTFSSGAKQDVTNSVAWASSNPVVATISTSGMARAVGQGSATISASSGGVTNSTGLSIKPPVLVSISVVPANALVDIGAPVQFTAIGTLGDGSTQDLTNKVSWASSNKNVATVSATGLVTGVTDGTMTISASFDSTTGMDAVTVATSTGLPTGIGWHALASNTMLQASGACPPDNFGGDTFPFTEQCSSVIRSWSGAIADTTANRLIIWGGGANNYYGNEIYSLNLSANPVTLTRVKDPTVPTNYANSQDCVESIPPGTTDASPNSRSSYGGMAFLPGAYVMYIVDGALACRAGSGSTGTWTVPLQDPISSNSWMHMNPTLLGPLPGSSGGFAYGNVAEYDPSSGLVFVSDSAAMYTYDLQTNTYNRITAPQGFITSIYLSGAIDPVRKLLVLVGGCTSGTCSSGEGVFVADISNPASTIEQNWTAATMADPICAEYLSGGANSISASNPGFTFDSVANDFVGWPNQGNSVYVLTPDPTNQRLTCQKETFLNGPPNSAHLSPRGNTSNGTFGRFQYFPGPDVFVLVNDWNIPGYILRLR